MERDPKKKIVLLLFAARALATYLIPGCIGRRVRLGSKSSSGAGIWKSGSLEIWGPGSPEIWNPKNQKIKISKFKCVLPTMSSSSGSVGNKFSQPYLGPSEVIFSMDRKNVKKGRKLPILLGGPMGPIHPVWAPAGIAAI